MEITNGAGLAQERLDLLPGEAALDHELALAGHGRLRAELRGEVPRTPMVRAFRGRGCGAYRVRCFSGCFSDV